MRASLSVLLFVIVTRTISQACDYQNSVELINRSYNGIEYNDGEYFVDNKTGVERGCVCMKETCARKCCPFGQGYNEDNFKCVDLSKQFDPPVYEGSEVKLGFNITKEFHFFLSKMKCASDKNESRIFIGSVTDDFHLNTNGKLHVTLEDSIPEISIYGPDKYCIDNFLAEDNVTIHVNALVCFVGEQDTYHYALNSSCMLISCFFIILTVAVYVFLPELRNTIHGMVMITYLLCFFVSFLVMATMQILLITKNITQKWCTGMTFVIYFFTLAAFFWLNVMCYDLWRKFKRMNVTTRGITTGDRIRFLRYSAYAFGVPTVLTILVAALEFSYHPKYNKYLPNIRLQGCFLNGIGRLLYFYTPMIAVCVTNLIFFALVAIKLAEIKKQTQRVQKNDTQRLMLYIKLFLVTGTNWVLEAISSCYPNIGYLWQFTDAYNILVGLLIFVIFVCKKKILFAIKQKSHSFVSKATDTTSV